MADYSNMTDEQYRALMAQQAKQQMQPVDDGTGFRPDILKKQLGNALTGIGHAIIPPGLPGAAPYPARTAAPVQQPTVNEVPQAIQRPPEASEVDNTGADNSQEQQTSQQAQTAPQGMPAHGDPYSSLMNLSNANTASTLQGLATAQSDYTKAMQETEAAKRKEAEYNAKTDADVAKLNQAAINDQHEQAAQAAIKEANRQQDVNIEMDKYESIKDDYLNSKVDPDAHWKHGLFGDNMTGNKIVAAFGLLLSGLGGAQSVQTTSNIINSAIDRDIRVQSDQIARKGRAADMQHNIVGMYRQQYADQTQADLAAKMAMQEHAVDVMEQRRKMAKGQQELNTADAAIAAMKTDFAKTQQDFLKVSNAVVTQGISQQGNLQNLHDENDYRHEMVDAKREGKEEKVSPQVAKVFDEMTKLKNGVDMVQAGQEKYKKATSGVGESVLQYVPGTDAYDYRQFKNSSAGEMAPALFPGTRQNAYTEQRSRDIIPSPGDFRAKGNAFYGEKMKEAAGQMHNRLQQLKAMHAPASVVEDAEQMIRELGGQGGSETNTRTVNGKTYRKVPGGWQIVQ